MAWQWICKRFGGKRSGTRPLPHRAPGGTPAEPDAGIGGAGGNPLGNVILAQLLLELPEHQAACAAAWRSGDLEQLGRCVHKLAGAVAYCDLPELAAALNGLREALKSGDAARTRTAWHAASRCMTALLERSGTHPARPDS